MADRNEQSMISFKVDSVVKESAEAVLAGSGLNTSAYLGMCLRKLAQGGEVPFELKVDSMFWIWEAKVSKAVTYIKSGAFHEAIAIQTEVGKLFETEIEKLFLKLVASEETGAKSKDIFVDQLTSGFIPAAATSTSSIRSYTENIIPLISSIDEPSADNVVSQIRDIANQVEEKAASLVKNSKIIDLIEETTIGNNTEELRENVELTESIIETVLDAYEENRDQLAMRFVGSEFGIEEVAKVSIKRNAIMKYFERAQKKADQKKNHEFEQGVMLLEALNASNR